MGLTMTDQPAYDTICLPRTGSAAITFRGRLLAHSQPGEDVVRWHVLQLYAIEGGGYVIAIVYGTRWRKELGREDVYVVGDDPSAVTRALELHDPTAAVQGYPPDARYAEKQRRLLRDIRARYQVQVSDLLWQVDITVRPCDLSPATKATFPA